MADPAALAAATGGLLVRDLVAGISGADIAAVDRPDGTRYPDRAALMEQAWERADPQLTEPFPLSRSSRQVPWRLIFNSTSVRTECRVLVADVQTRVSELTAPGAPDCFLGTAEAAGGSYDLFDAEPCLSGMRTSTAAMLSARFAYITPSGVVPGCARTARSKLTVDTSQQTDQLIDGGYDESSGLGTLVDLAPQIIPLIRAHNQAALASRSHTVTVVVPTIVYLDNHIRADPPAGPPRTCTLPKRSCRPTK